MTGVQTCALPICDYFKTGRGSIKQRGRVGVEQLKGNREQIVITQIPYMVNRATMVQKIAALANDKTITDISAVRDESDENTRVVVELKRDAVPKVVINKLYKFTQLATSFSVNSLAIDHGRPKTMNIKEMINAYIEHRREVILRRTRFELAKAEARAETLEGYLCALANLDEFIRIIRNSNNRDEARIKLLAFEFPEKVLKKWGIKIRNEERIKGGFYLLSEVQVNSILELRLYQLTGLEQDKIKGEYDELLVRIEDLMDIIAREDRVLSIIKEGLAEIKDKYATPRRTDIVPDEGDMAIEDLIANEGVIITLTHNGLVKRTNVSSYRAQRRGGKGVIGMGTRKDSVVKGEAEDFIEHLFTASTHDYLMFFTTAGRVYVRRVHEIPDMGRSAKGRNIANLLELQSGEKIAALIRVESHLGPDKENLTWQQENFLFFATESGTVKKTALGAYANVRRTGINAIGINEGDRLITVKLTTGHDEVVLITSDGKSIRFNEENVRSMGRTAAGVRGIRLGKKDRLVAAAIVAKDATLLVAGENGVGKRTEFDEYRTQTRGGKGIITMKTTAKTGEVCGALAVKSNDEIKIGRASWRERV